MAGSLLTQLIIVIALLDTGASAITSKDAIRALIIANLAIGLSHHNLSIDDAQRSRVAFRQRRAARYKYCPKNNKFHHTPPVALF
jgi:hypothetical protein